MFLKARTCLLIFRIQLILSPRIVLKSTIFLQKKQISYYWQLKNWPLYQEYFIIEVYRSEMGISNSDLIMGRSLYPVALITKEDCIEESKGLARKWSTKLNISIKYDYGIRDQWTLLSHYIYGHWLTKSDHLYITECDKLVQIPNGNSFAHFDLQIEK